MNEPSQTAGGRATEAGMAFQASVATWFAANLIADVPIGSVFGLSANARITAIQCETGDAIDDVVIRLANASRIFTQCKTRSGLTPSPDSPLASALGQLARLYARGGMQITPDHHDVALLAVSDAAPRSLDDLETACRMFDRGGSWTEVMASLSQTRRDALGLFRTHIRAGFSEVPGVTLSESDLASMARMFRIKRFPESVVDAEWRQVSQLLGRRVYGGDETGDGPMSSLLALCRRAIQTGAPLERQGLLRSLRAIGHVDVAAPAFDNDISALLQYSSQERQRLRKHTVLPIADATPIPRDCLEPLLEATVAGSLLVTGEPGAGKTGVLLQLANRLEDEPGPVLFLSVERFSGISLRVHLREELGIQHDPVDVLAAWPGEAPGVLIIDALDASRGGLSEPIIAAFIADAIEKVGSRWSVVASIRSFDLHNGRRFRELMRGTPPNRQYADPILHDVRHLHVQTLSETEFSAVANGSPVLRDLYESTSRLWRNVFNLSLAAELLASHVDADSIRGLATQSELISKYEDIRLPGHSVRRAARAVVALMVERRRLVVPIILVEHEAVTEVCEAGVLVPAGGDNVAFAHHVLFDHIAGRFYLDEDPALLRNQLAGDVTMGLVLGPALRFALERMWRSDSAAHLATWKFLAALAAETPSSPIVLSIALRTAAEQVADTTDVAGLLDLVSTSTDPGVIGKLLGHVARFARIANSDPSSNRLPVGKARAWAAVALRAASLGNVVAADAARVLLMTLDDRADMADAEVQASFGAAARALLAATWSIESQIPAPASAAIRFVTRSFGSDPTASRSLLTRILGERFEGHASAEAPWLAEGIRFIVPHDPSFAAFIYATLFSRDVADESMSWMGGTASRILPLRSTHRQDYQHARWHLTEALAEFLASEPGLGTTAVIDAVRGIDSEQRLERHQSAPTTKEIEIEGRTLRIIDDYLSLQDWSRVSRDIEPLSSFSKFLQECSPEAFRSVVETTLGATANSAIWARIFGVAKDRLGIADDLLRPLVTQPRFLSVLGVMRDGINFLTADYPDFPDGLRAAFEARLLMLNSTQDERDATMWQTVTRRLLSGLPESALASDGMRALRAEMENRGELNGNRPILSVEVGSSPVEDIVDELLRRSGVDLEHSPEREIRLATNLVEEQFKLAGAGPNAAELIQLWSHIIDLVRVLDDSLSLNPHPELLRSSWGVVSNGVEFLAQSPSYAPSAQGHPDLDALLQVVERLAASPFPELPDNAETPSSLPSWGNWDVRVYAASSLVALAHRFGGDRPELVDRLGPFLDDPVRTVRLQVVQALNVFYDVAQQRMWALIEKVTASETDSGVLTFFVGGPLRALADAYPERIAGLLSPILEREWAAAEVATERSGRDHDAEAAADLVARLFLRHNRPEAWGWIDRWAGDVRRGEVYTTRMLFQLRHAFFATYLAQSSSETDPIFSRTHRLLDRVITAAAAALIEARSSLPDSPDAETVGRWRPVFLAADRVIDQVCNQLYFGSGAFRSQEDRVIGLPTAESKRRFIAEYGPVLDILDAHGQARTIHNLIELYGFLAEGHPEAVFERVADLLLGSGAEDGYHFESLGAQSCVTLVKAYLADHRNVFDDPGRRARLIQVLDLFSGVGWPEPLKLLFDLPDLLR